jgi:hypothetical protein
MILFFRHFAKNILKIRIVFLSQISLSFGGKNIRQKRIILMKNAENMISLDISLDNCSI